MRANDFKLRNNFNVGLHNQEIKSLQKLGFGETFQNKLCYFVSIATHNSLVISYLIFDPYYLFCCLTANEFKTTGITRLITNNYTMITRKLNQIYQ